MIRKIARPMIASVYIADGADTVLNSQAHVEGTEAMLDRIRYLLPRKYAKRVSQDPATVTRGVGLTKIGAGTMLAFGKAPRISATILAVLTIPTIIARNAFWETQDQIEKTSRRNGFLTNIALLGGLFITSVDNQGKPGLKWRANSVAKRGKKQLQQTLASKSETEKVNAAARGWLNDAGEYLEENKKNWASSAKQAGQTFATKAQSRLEDGPEEWLESAQKNAKVAKKSVVKAANEAQKKAREALDNSDSFKGLKGKKAKRRYKKLQKKADQAISTAQKKTEKFFAK